jgi:uncharacterized protein (TIGR02246 family)
MVPAMQGCWGLDQNEQETVMKFIVGAISLLFITATAYAAGDVRSEIEAVNQKLGTDFAKGNAAAISKLYTPTAMMFPPGSGIVSGREAIEKEWEGTIKSGMKFVGLKTIAVEEYGHDVAREIGHFTVEVPNPQKEMTKVEGKYVVVWKHVDDKWMLDSDIWNMNSQ